MTSPILTFGFGTFGTAYNVPLLGFPVGMAPPALGVPDDFAYLPYRLTTTNLPLRPTIATLPYRAVSELLPVRQES